MAVRLRPAPRPSGPWPWAAPVVLASARMRTRTRGPDRATPPRGPTCRHTGLDGGSDQRVRWWGGRQDADDGATAGPAPARDPDPVLARGPDRAAPPAARLADRQRRRRT